MKNKAEKRIFNTKIELRAHDDGSQAVGYGAVFDKLSDNLGGFREIIAPGAFDDVLNDDVRALINHDSNLILGRTVSKTLSLSVDQHGLRYEIDLPDTSYARDLAETMKRGDITQSSFAFTVDEDSWDEDDEGRIVRTIKKVRALFDVSPVTYPAYPDASAGMRSLENYRESKNKLTAKRESESRAREMILDGVVTPE